MRGYKIFVRPVNTRMASVLICLLWLLPSLVMREVLASHMLVSPSSSLRCFVTCWINTRRRAYKEDTVCHNCCHSILVYIATEYKKVIECQLQLGIVGRKTYWTASVTKEAFNILLFFSIGTPFLIVITEAI